MTLSRMFNSPIVLPIIFFVIVILLGSILLHGSEKNKIDALSWTDAAFTATSAACVTGLVVVDTGSYFTQFGQVTILLLMQIGGLGIMTFTSLSIYIWRRRTTITDRIAVGQILLHDATFNLGRFLIEIVCWTFVIESAGAVLLWLMDPVAFSPLSALFHSITARTAGFNTLDIGRMTNVSLMVLLFLMFIGGAPGSCAGGIKVTTLRVLAAAMWSQMRGKAQASIGKYAIRENAVKKAMVLFILASMIIFLAAFLLDFTEGGNKSHLVVRGQFLEILFESVSAFCTVGLSTGLTAKLSVVGKWIIISLMFIGRLGPFVLIAALQSVQETQHYRLPEETLMIG